jgi:hypothetical protein
MCVPAVGESKISGDQPFRKKEESFPKHLASTPKPVSKKNAKSKKEIVE